MHLSNHRVAGSTRGRPSKTSSWLAMAAAAILALGTASAQETPRPLGSLLPATTVVAFHFNPDTTGHDFLAAVAGDLDLGAARVTIGKLVRLIGPELGGEFGQDFDKLLESGIHGLMDGSLAELSDLADECPDLHAAVMNGSKDELLGPTALAVSMSRYNPMPGALLVTRPGDTTAADAVYDALIGCFDAGVSLKQDGVDLHLFADGSDQPVLVARVAGAYMVSTDQDLLRSSVRLALGSTEPSHISHRVGSLAAGPMSRGVGMTLDLAALADALDGLRGFLPQEEPVTVVVDRLLASLRVVNGVAVSVRVDDAGLALETLVTIDEGVAHGTGETALLDLLTCAGCKLGSPALIPTGAASVYAGTFSPSQLVAWLDSWLADLRELGAGDLDVRGLVSEYLGIDLDVALLDWFGTSWLTAQLDVYDTDLRAWLNSPATISLIPVTDEAAARRGVAQWQAVVRGFTGLTERLLDGSGMGYDYGDQAGAALANLDMLSVRTATYRGVTYERWRLGPVSDSALAVFGGHLVVAMPATAIEDVIDVYLGAPNVTSDPKFGPLLAGQPSGATAYEVVDVPRYLRGLAKITDLASAPIATGFQVAVTAGLERGGGGRQPAIDPADVPTFDDWLNLTDLGTQVLEVLAARTGTTVGTTENVGGVIWTTWRLPLRK